MFRPACSTAVVTVGGERLRIAWTNAGIAFIEKETLRAKGAIARRMRMDLTDAALPAALLDTLLETAAGSNNGAVPLDLSWANEFEREVLDAARQIPCGETRPYNWLAREARRPLAVRAAASVMARNPLWLLVPCHRVIYADGTLGPYGSSGAQRKRTLLKREGVEVRAHATKQRAGKKR
ncbi:MAG: cysteine methyltransferase [Candidatus Eremiobacter antarcticus]|nr:MGMT family protein [Candidatus Eremiobacteraeota bacterium]MBC5807843.1 MGMT family protein [Candidatus Eremiobacteraeota bacterium]PZR62782.1 MAG: cysteine methyltransferase [Candidatus Eremiobacter sp. RRmetagenome_bin22]